MDEHLAGKLFGNVEEPNPPWAFWRLSVSFVDEREDNDETQQTLNYLYGCVRWRQDEGNNSNVRGQLGRGDDRSVCRRRGSRPGLGMRVVVEMTFAVPYSN